MDWPRAKVLLLVAFAVLDLSLGFLWFSYRSERLSRAAVPLPELAGEVKDNLAEAGIVLLGGVPAPEEIPAEMRRLRVKPWPPDAEELTRAFFPEGAQSTAWPGSDAGNGDPAGKSFRHGAERLTVLARGLVFYERGDLALGGGVETVMDTDVARSLADAFLKRAGLGSSLGEPDLVAVGGEALPAYQVMYFQHYEDWPVFSGYTVVEVVPGGVRALEQLWVKPQGFVGPRRPVISYEQALVNLAAALRADGNGERLLVEKVSLGYFSRSDPSAREWEAWPVWRVHTRGGLDYYVNAYTGFLERDERQEEATDDQAFD